MAGIERLHPHFQHAIIHDFGWRSLRPVQELTIDGVLDGCNLVVLAPTAGGKTEAAMFPLLSRILSEELKPVSVLYVCPIRALLNNQEERLQSYARSVGMEVFKWHGDVTSARKQRFRDAPAHILMTTPESLEVMLISAKTDAKALFANLAAVVVDEVHAFAGDDRGAHLVSVLERLVRFCGRDIQRIGLSATVGNPHVIGRWLQGSSQRPFRLIDPPKGPPQRDLRIELYDDISQAAPAIGKLARHKKSLVFVESRSKAEKVAHALAGTGVEVFIHHSSVSRADRTLAEEQFARGQNTAIVCTSTMELGIDVGDLDQVIQVDAPTSVASFLQRLGRTGRRANTRANCTFFCLSSESLLQSVALLRLAQAGWVEDVQPAAHAMHVLAHQIMALVLQEGGMSRHLLLPWVETAWPFSTIRSERFQELVDTMVERDILYEGDGLLSLGGRGEKLYGRKNFFELYAVFTAPPMMRVQHGKDDVGYIQSMFVSVQDKERGPLCFRLAGRAWTAAHIDWSRGVMHVKPAEQGRVPSWLGLPSALSNHLCQTMMTTLLESGDESGWLARGAALELEALRDSYRGLLAPGEAALEYLESGVQWHTFAGGAVNRLLSTALGSVSGKHWTAGNLSLRSAEISPAEAHEAIDALSGMDWEAVAKTAAKNMARGMLSKFQPCLPRDAEDRLLAERLLDLSGTLHFLATVKVRGVRIARRTDGVRLADSGREIHLPIQTEATGPLSGFSRPTSRIQWVDSTIELVELASKLELVPAIGLDVESTLDLGKLCLIQIALPGLVYLIDPITLDSLEPLRKVLSATGPIKIIHNADFERRILGLSGFQVDNVADTLTLSRQLRGDVLGGHSLSAVCERELGIALDKSEQTSNWSRRPLSVEQMLYSALDAEVLLPLHQKLLGLVTATKWIKVTDENWTTLNDRRIELIDKDIDGLITFAEKQELTSLEDAMSNFLQQNPPLSYREQ